MYNFSSQCITQPLLHPNPSFILSRIKPLSLLHPYLHRTRAVYFRRPHLCSRSLFCSQKLSEAHKIGEQNTEQNRTGKNSILTEQNRTRTSQFLFDRIQNRREHKKYSVFSPLVLAPSGLNAWILTPRLRI